jgi:hypothetical protein
MRLPHSVREENKTMPEYNREQEQAPTPGVFVVSPGARTLVGYHPSAEAVEQAVQEGTVVIVPGYGCAQWDMRLLNERNKEYCLRTAEIEVVCLPEEEARYRGLYARGGLWDAYPLP